MLSKTMEEKINQILSDMSLEEKLNQMQQLSYQLLPADEFEAVVKKGQLGSYLHVLGSETGKYVDGAKESRMGIPPIFGIDAIHGHALLPEATVFPSQLALACSFDEELVEQVGYVTAKEVAADGLDWVFSPVLCMGRDLRWGRVDETFGEDAELISRLGAAIIRGYQTDNLTAACAKHYLGYGEATGGRDSYDSEFTERKARELFLKPFEAAVKAGCMTFMTAYGSVDGTPLTINTRYVREILKDELGFEGFVVTDWHNFGSLVTGQHVASDATEAAVLGVNAGNDMSMNTPAFAAGVWEGVKDGKIPMEYVDDAVRRILRVKARLGLLDGTRQRPERTVIGCEEHRNVNKRAARESIVLLENNGVLPLQPKNIRKIAVVGPNADDWQAQYGDWTYVSHPDPKPDAQPTEKIYTTLRGIREVFPDAEVVYAKGCVIEEEIARDESDALMNAALQAACDADVIIAVLGDNLKENGENRDRARLDLYGRQDELVEKLAALGKPLISVIVSGKPLVLTRVKAASDALVQCFNGGDLGGKAVAELLCGQQEFVGRLPISFPYDSAALPCYYNQYDYWHGAKYVDVPQGSLYSFGYGLSYARCSCGAPQLSDAVVTKNDTVTLTVPVTNTGSHATTEVVQLYFRDVVCKKLTPTRTLLDFCRVEIPAGQTVNVVFTFDVQRLGYVADDMQNTVDAGDFTLTVCGGSDAPQTVTLTVKE